MSGEQGDGFVSNVHERLKNARGTIEHTVGDVSNNASSALDDAVTVVDKSTDSVATFVSEMSSGAFEIVSIVADIAEEHITENEFDIKISNHQMRIEGDEEGLQRIETDLKQALKGYDVYIEYDREDGINIEFED